MIKVIKKASVYSLVAVSMNLLNGFTGLFSLGQAGFMLLGAYSYAVLCIPVAKRAGVYQYFDGGIVKFSLPEIFASFLGDKVGSAVGMILALLVGGLIAAFFAYLIGLPVLRLKSRLPRYCDPRLCRDHAHHYPMERHRPADQRLEPSQGLSRFQQREPRTCCSSACSSRALCCW